MATLTHAYPRSARDASVNGLSGLLGSKRDTEAVELQDLAYHPASTSDPDQQGQQGGGLFRHGSKTTRPA